MNTIKDIVTVVAILATTAFLFYVADYGGLIQFFLVSLLIWILIVLIGGSYFIWQYRRRGGK